MYNSGSVEKNVCNLNYVTHDQPRKKGKGDRRAGGGRKKYDNHELENFTTLLPNFHYRIKKMSEIFEDKPYI